MRDKIPSYTDEQLSDFIDWDADDPPGCQKVADARSASGVHGERLFVFCDSIHGDRLYAFTYRRGARHVDGGIAFGKIQRVERKRYLGVDVLVNEDGKILTTEGRTT